VQQLVRDLNALYRQHAPLHRFNFSSQGFEWIDCNDATQSVLAYLRRDEEQFLVVVLNFTPVVRENYRVGVPVGGVYREVLNSDSLYYRGSDVSNGQHIVSEPLSWMGRPCSLALTLPPLAGIVLQLEQADG
jgi:1,4-alpha-glucan branching enzyme